MELTVSPDDLHAAAAAISRCAGRLESSRDVFVSLATGAVPALGPHASDAAGRSSRATDAATEVVVDDVRHLATALRVLAHVYARVDATAVAPR
jgi:hypothetical protein